MSFENWNKYVSETIRQLNESWDAERKPHSRKTAKTGTAKRRTRTEIKKNRGN